MKTFHFIGLVGGAGAAGTSLEPDLKQDARQLAEQMGFGSLSNFTRFLLTQELARAKGEKSYKLNTEPKSDLYNTNQKSGYSRVN